MSCCAPPARLRLSCCCCGDMLSIQPPDALRLTVPLSSGDAADTEIPLMTSVSGTNTPSQHNTLVRGHWKTSRVKRSTWSAGRKMSLDEFKKQTKNFSLSSSPSSPSMRVCAVTKGSSCLDYQPLCHFLMRLYAQDGGGASTLQKIGPPIFNPNCSIHAADNQIYQQTTVEKEIIR